MIGALFRLFGCPCEKCGAPASLFKTREVGCDLTAQRYAEVTLNRCGLCGRLWLRYHVEYEFYSRSGRWARGLIDETDAAAVTPETAARHIDGLDWYLYGGSYFDGRCGRGSGPMHWGL